MIYVPDIENYKCFVVNGDGVIRAYEQVPRNNSTINYRDYYIKSNYIYRDGSQQFSQYATLPICLSKEVVTNNVYYRNDLADILIIFAIVSIVVLYFPLKIFFRLFKRGRIWKKLIILF